MKKNKQKIICIINLIIIILILVTGVKGLETKTIIENNETISITPQITEIPLNTTIKSVFKIERTNYENGIEPLEINYIQKLIKIENESEITINEISINKSINKYTISKTGYIFTTENGTFILRFEKINSKNNLTEKLEWTLKTNYKNNQTTNNTTTNETNNQNNNETINNSNCFEFVEMKTNKEIFSVNEQLEISFEVEPQNSKQNITYWIENINGEIIKEVRTSENTNTKHYTFKTKDEGQAFFVKGIIRDQCRKIEVKKLIATKKEPKTNKEIMKTKITIDKISNENSNEIQRIKTTITILKGNTSKTTCDIYLVGENNKTISPHYKLKLTKKESQGTITIELPIYNQKNKKIKLIVKGLGKKITKTINIKQTEKKTTTKQNNEKKEKNAKEKKTNSTKENTNNETTKAKNKTTNLEMKKKNIDPKLYLTNNKTINKKELKEIKNKNMIKEKMTSIISIIIILTIGTIFLLKKE